MHSYASFINFLDEILNILAYHTAFLPLAINKVINCQKQLSVFAGPSCSILWIFILFSPLGKLADRAIYFTFRNFFFFYSEQSYLSIYWTNFHDLFTKWKVFAWIFLIRSTFSDYSRDVAMATNLVTKMGQNCLPPLYLLLCHSETVWDNAVYVQD